MTLIGKISITRMRGPEGEVVRLAVMDDLSGAEFLAITLPRVAFDRALAETGHASCQLLVKGLHLVGRRREVKEEIVTVPDGPIEYRRERAIEACRRHELDGWRARYSDAMRPDRAVRGSPGQYRVAYTRYVDTAAPDVGEAAD